MIILEKKYLKSGEAKKLLHVDEKTLRNWEKSGKLIPHHVDPQNGYKYYTREQIYEFNKEHYNKKFSDEKMTITKPEMPEKQELLNNDDVSNEILTEEIKISEITSDNSEMTKTSTISVEEVESKAIVAKYHYFSTAKPVRRLTQICVNEMVHIPLGKTGYVEVTLISGDIENPKTEHPTLLDVALIEGVVSLKKAGNKVFSVTQLLRHLNGNSRNGCTDEKIVEVTKRLRKMMEWRIRIDARPEFEHYKKLPSEVIEKAVFEGHLLNIVYLETTNWRGEKNIMFGFPINNCFEIPKDKSVAITHEAYSETIGKLTCFPTELLDITGVRKTDQNKIIANYLLQKIQGLKNNKRGIHSILFETLQKDCELNNYSKQQMYKIREVIIKMLEHWKDHKHIEDYKLIKDKSGVYHSIDVELAEVKKKNVRNGTGRGNKIHTRKPRSVSDTNG